ncbi:hypothetical protein [Costertonia aggregata]|uniref:DUF2269 family protein n=1 Tax=Costertonia aggregata TaxID=343403 RepID=A0A7H9ANK5_9FLAO|nr:hypothetical protein [Costertonia aggregata]QLG45041.1 hypothetical protein HYG79_06640 [Costertonia aggregata]
MNTFLVLKYFHILLFVFWLGTDMGTYYSSKFVINPKLTAPQRATALQILLGCDLGPRIAMPLIMPTGIHMGSLLGIVKINTLGLGLVWTAGLIWLVLVLNVHFSKDEVQKKKLKDIDFWVRPLIVCLVGGFAIYSLVQPDYIVAPWMNYKLLVVCGLILCGLGIRYQLGKFTPAFINLMQGKEVEESNIIMKKRMDNCLPYVYGIWIGLLLNAAWGVHLI